MKSQSSRILSYVNGPEGLKNDCLLYLCFPATARVAQEKLLRWQITPSVGQEWHIRRMLEVTLLRNNLRCPKLTEW